MSVLRISLFGGVRVEYDERPPTERVTRSVQTLLAYLLLQRHRSHSREVLSGVFWGDHSEDNARGCLNTALWRLRRVLEPDGVPRGTYLTNKSNGEVGFNRDSNYWLDVAVLEECASRVLSESVSTLTQTDMADLDVATRLYSGDLLEGIYSDWALRERERLRTLYLNSLARLMGYYKHREDYETSLECGRKILIHDPLREEIHREMMRLYLANGQRTLAVRQYETCRDLLSSELDVDPMEETQAAYAQIGGAGSNRRGRMANDAPAASQFLLVALREAVHRLDQAREHFQDAIRLAERLTQIPKRE